MSCSTMSNTYHQTPNSVGSPRLIARGIPETDYDTYDRTNDIVSTDHWKHQSTRPHPEQQPRPHPHTPSSYRTRHTHSPSRTQFEYHPRTRFDYNPSSVPSSPLSMSGVYTTPPSSAHLHPPSSTHLHSPSFYNFSPVAQASSITSLTSSGGVYGAPPSPQPPSHLTSSFPSLPSQPTNHLSQHPTRQERYTNQGGFLPSETGGTSRSSRSYITHLRSDKHHHLNNDWQSESWSGGGTTSSSSSHRQHPSTNIPSAYPLSQKYSSNYPGQRGGMIGDLPSPSSEDHSDSSPPSSRMVSPYDFVGGPYQQHRSSSNPPMHLIDIMSHPSDQVIELGDPIQLHCEARILHSSVKPTYQWYKDEEPIIGEVGTVFRLSRTGKEELGYYFCVVSNSVDDSQRKSSTACIRVANGSAPPIDGCVPYILNQPDPAIVIILGETLVLRLVVQAQPEPVYQWFKNGNEIHSTNTYELVVSCCTVSDEGTYVCSIKNVFGSILSSSFKVYVSRRRDPLEKRNSANSTTSEHGGMIHTPPPSSPLSWRSVSPTKLTRHKINNIPDEVVRLVTAQICRQIGPGENIEGVRKGLNISMEDAESIKLCYTSLTDRVHELINAWIRANPFSSTTSLEDSLQVYGFQILLPHSISQSPPIIKVHPSSVEVNEGDTVELFIEAEGLGLSYQWYKDGIPYPGLTHPIATLTDVQECSNGLYHCSVKNSYGCVNSHPARVDVIILKLKLPPSLQGSKTYYKSVSSHESVGGVFSPPPARARSSGCGQVEPFSPEKKVNVQSYGNRGRFNSSVSEKLENFRVENSNHVPVILEQPISQELFFATELKLKVFCNDRVGSKLRYLWYFNGLALPIERENEFIINSFTDEDVGDYYCVVSNEYGSVMSSKAHITLRPDKEDEDN